MLLARPSSVSLGTEQIAEHFLCMKEAGIDGEERACTSRAAFILGWACCEGIKSDEEKMRERARRFGTFDASLEEEKKKQRAQR